MGLDFVCDVDQSDQADNSWEGDFDLFLADYLWQEVTVTMKVSVEPLDPATTGQGSQCVSWPDKAC